MEQKNFFEVNKLLQQVHFASKFKNLGEEKIRIFLYLETLISE